MIPDSVIPTIFDFDDQKVLACRLHECSAESSAHTLAALLVECAILHLHRGHCASP